MRRNRVERHCFQADSERVNAEQGVASVSRSFFGRVGFDYRWTSVRTTCTLFNARHHFAFGFYYWGYWMVEGGLIGSHINFMANTPCKKWAVNPPSSHHRPPNPLIWEGCEVGASNRMPDRGQLNATSIPWRAKYEWTETCYLGDTPLNEG